MVKVLLGLRGIMQSDAADALAIAVCHSQARLTQKLFARAKSA
jgi:Holliday junction resolvasome RuvABC endonuclease subunit